jgi:Tfp pilus assembly protein PilF
LKIIDESFRVMPDAPTTFHLRGWIQEAARDLPAAKESYERTLSLSRNHVQALAGLASVAVQMGNFTTARERAAQALALEPRQATATIALATVEIRQGEATAAETRLRGLLSGAALPTRARAMALGALGDALDAQSRAADAIAARQERDEILRAAAPASAPSNDSEPV